MSARFFEDSAFGRCLLLSPPGIELVAQNGRVGARNPLDLVVQGKNVLSVLAREGTPIYERDREALHNNKREILFFFLYLLREGEPREVLSACPERSTF